MEEKEENDMDVIEIHVLGLDGEGFALPLAALGTPCQVGRSQRLCSAPGGSPPGSDGLRGERIWSNKDLLRGGGPQGFGT